MLAILAALSISAAIGLRIALPLLLIGILYTELWSNVPFLSAVPQPVVLGVLVSWSLAELFLTKQLLGQRVIQVVQLICSPGVGAIAGITIARSAQVSGEMLWLLGIISGLLAFVLQLVQVGWFFQLRGLPISVILIQDVLCITLVLLAFDAPKQGAIVALLLLWLTLRSSIAWRRKSQLRPHKYLQYPD